MWREKNVIMFVKNFQKDSHIQIYFFICMVNFILISKSNLKKPPRTLLRFYKVHVQELFYFNRILIYINPTPSATRSLPTYP